MFDGFFETTHARMRCIDCHGGIESARSRAEAHEGMDPLPSSGYESSVCAACHEGIVTRFPATLHADTRGISGRDDAIVLERADPEAPDALYAGFDAQCGTCHVSACGDCHVTRPQKVDGGFVNGHIFSRSPNTVQNCIACHGSRVEREYLGKGESDVCELTADVHWNPGALQCTDCHGVDWIHGDGASYSRRYDNEGAPRCEECHAPTTAFMAIEYHEAHVAGADAVLLQCQVCHAQDYNNCVGCHIAEDENGASYFETEGSYFDLKIGRNYLKSEERPWDYIVVRRVPVFAGTFDFYGEGALPNLDALPTFKYATPHSISRVPRQSQTCEACHDDDSIFLTPEDLTGLPEAERRANASVVVDR